MRSFSELINNFVADDDVDDKVIFNDNDFVTINDNFIHIKKAGIYEKTLFRFTFLNGTTLNIIHNAIFAYDKNGLLTSLSKFNTDVPFLLSRIPI